MLLRYPLFNRHQWQHMLLKLAGLLASLVAFEPQHTPPLPSIPWFPAPLPVHTLFHTPLALLDSFHLLLDPVSWQLSVACCPACTCTGLPSAPFSPFHSISCTLNAAGRTHPWCQLRTQPMRPASQHNLHSQCPVGSHPPVPGCCPLLPPPVRPPDCIPNSTSRMPCQIVCLAAPPAPLLLPRLPSPPAVSWPHACHCSAPQRPLDTLRACYRSKPEPAGKPYRGWRKQTIRTDSKEEQAGRVYREGDVVCTRRRKQSVVQTGSGGASENLSRGRTS